MVADLTIKGKICKLMKHSSGTIPILLPILFTLLFGTKGKPVVPVNPVAAPREPSAKSHILVTIGLAVDSKFFDQIMNSGLGQTQRQKMYILSYLPLV